MARFILGVTTMAIIVAAVSVLPASFAQSSSTTLYMEPLPPLVGSGDTVVFTGELKTVDGHAIPNAEITIFHGDVVYTDLVRTTTSEDGIFWVQWQAQPVEDESEIYLYANFDGFGRFEGSESSTYGVTVIGSAAEEVPEDTGGCLIATAAYGSELAPQVQFLREIRDNMLLPTAAGASFMAGFNELYYSFSPAVADLERESPAFRDTLRTAITPAIYALSIMALADSDSEMSVLALGIASICAIAGIYVVAPSLAVYCIARRIRR